MRIFTGFLLAAVLFLTVTCVYMGLIIHQQEVAIDFLLGDSSEK